jgi:hypothetical protein
MGCVGVADHAWHELEGWAERPPKFWGAAATDHLLLRSRPYMTLRSSMITDRGRRGGKGAP